MLEAMVDSLIVNTEARLQKPRALRDTIQTDTDCPDRQVDAQKRKMI